MSRTVRIHANKGQCYEVSFDADGKAVSVFGILTRYRSDREYKRIVWSAQSAKRMSAITVAAIRAAIAAADHRSEAVR